jgi:hypothetical protein
VSGSPGGPHRRGPRRSSSERGHLLRPRTSAARRKKKTPVGDGLTAGAILVRVGAAFVVWPLASRTWLPARDDIAANLASIGPVPAARTFGGGVATKPRPTDGGRRAACRGTVGRAGDAGGLTSRWGWRRWLNPHGDDRASRRRSHADAASRPVPRDRVPRPRPVGGPADRGRRGGVALERLGRLERDYRNGKVGTLLDAIRLEHTRLGRVVWIAVAGILARRDSSGRVIPSHDEPVSRLRASRRRIRGAVGYGALQNIADIHIDLARMHVATLRQGPWRIGPL